MSPLERIANRVNRNGDVDDPATRRPMLTLEEFFEGNHVIGSICCNCTPIPRPAEVFDVLKRIRSRADVTDVRMQINVFDDPQWPFCETAWVITTAGPTEMKSLFPDSFAPDECWAGWQEGVLCETVEVPRGYQPVACWWD